MNITLMLQVLNLRTRPLPLLQLLALVQCLLDQFFFLCIYYCALVHNYVDIYFVPSLGYIWSLKSKTLFLVVLQKQLAHAALSGCHYLNHSRKTQFSSTKVEFSTVALNPLQLSSTVVDFDCV